MLWADGWGRGHGWGSSWSVCAPGQSLLLWGHQGPARALVLGCTGLLSCCLPSPALAGCCVSPPTCYGWWVCDVLGVLGRAELALCCSLSLSSLLQGFLYDLDKVSGSSAPSSSCLPCPRAWDALPPAPSLLPAPSPARRDRGSVGKVTLGRGRGRGS